MELLFASVVALIVLVVNVLSVRAHMRFLRPLSKKLGGRVRYRFPKRVWIEFEADGMKGRLTAEE